MLVALLLPTTEQALAQENNQNRLASTSYVQTRSANPQEQFHLSVLVDFIDDALEIHFTPDKIEQMMKLFQQAGVKRVYWQHYGGARTNFKFWNGFSSTQASRDTLRSLEGNPIRVAARKAKQAGLEIYAVIRPYENGLSRTTPSGSPVASAHPGVEQIGGPVQVLMDFVLQHPEMRIERRKTKIQDNGHRPVIRKIQLIKNDDRPTRLGPADIEIWTSPDNYQYKKREVSFTFSEHVEPASRDFVSFGKIKTAAGTPVRVLTLAGLNLTDKYVLLTTGHKQGSGDFRNLATEIIKAYDLNGKQIPTSVATSYATWNPHRNFRTNGLAFDTGFGSTEVTLDIDNSAGKGGFVAICGEKNEYLPASLCEAYPEVRQFWLRMVQECLDAGVDGVDLRVQCHSSWTDDPFEYGFNPPIVAQYKQRYGVDILHDDYDADKLADLRGEYYTRFVRSTSSMVRGAGKQMQVHINTDLLSPTYSKRVNPFTYPRNISFDWEKWLAEGMVDEVTLRSLVLRPDQLSTDAYSQRVIESCRKRGVPLHYNRYLNQVGPTFSHLKREIELIRDDGRFRSFILYEGKRLIGPAGDDAVGLRGGRFGTMAQWKQLTQELDQ